MKDQQERSGKDAGHNEQRHAEEARKVAKEQDRKKAYLAREQAIENASESKRSERARKREIQEAEQLAKDVARKKAYSDREKGIAEGQEARKRKASEKG